MTAASDFTRADYDDIATDYDILTATERDAAYDLIRGSGPKAHRSCADESTYCYCRTCAACKAAHSARALLRREEEEHYAAIDDGIRERRGRQERYL